MKVLITGANGLLGSNIIRQLELRNIKARALVRENAKLLSLRGTRPEYFFGNITSKEDMLKASSGCDYIIHTAAITDPTLPRLEQYLKVNVEGTKNIIDAGIKNDIRRLVYISTTNSIGYGDKDHPGTEDKPAMKPYTESYYAISKYRAEQEVMKAKGESGLDALILNPSFMIGPHDSKPSSGKLLLIGYRDRFVFITPGGRNFVPVRDVAVASCNALTEGRTGEKYLLTNANLSYSEFYDIVDDITGFKRIKVIIPPWLIRGTGALGSLAAQTGKAVLLNNNNSRILTVKNFYTAAKAIDELSFPQTDIRMAVREALDWFRENNYIKK